MDRYTRVPSTYNNYDKLYRQRGKILNDSQLQLLYKQKDNLLKALRLHQVDGICYCSHDKQEKRNSPCAWCLGNKLLKKVRG